jgi:hypothetical protein
MNSLVESKRSPADWLLSCYQAWQLVDWEMAICDVLWDDFQVKIDWRTATKATFEPDVSIMS